MIWIIFSCACWSFVCHLWKKCLFKYFDHIYKIKLFDFFFWVLICTSYSCIVETNPLSIIQFAKVFSHSVCCVFVLSMLLSLCKMLLQFTSKSVLSILSFRNFMVSILICRCLIYFCTWCEKTFYFLLIHVAVKFSHHWLLKNCLFSIVYSCFLCYRSIDHKCVGLFLDFLSCSIDQSICCCVSAILFQFL